MKQPFYTIDTHLNQEISNLLTKLYTPNHQCKLQSPSYFTSKRIGCIWQSGLHTTAKDPQSEMHDLISNT